MERTIRGCVVLLALMCVALPARDVAAAPAKSPNIVLIVTDDHGWSQTSELMDPRVPESRSTYLETPAIARLMQQGMRFTSGYAPSPLCTPTRRSILCGTTAARSGTEFASPDWVPADKLTIPKALKQANPQYRCAHFGKWGEQMVSTPEQSGYDASDGETGNNTGGMPRTLGVKNHNEIPHFIDNDDPKRTRTVTDRTIAFMREQKEAGRPFFVQASYYAVHLSVVTKEQTLKKYQAKGEPDRNYTQAWAAMMDDLDAGVGRLMASLDEMGLGDNTYVFFTADNGGRGTIPGRKTGAPANTPLEGAKHSLWEGGIRVPFVARGPTIKPGSVCHTPVAGYDLLATFYELAGGTAPLPAEVDGRSFAPLLADPQNGLFDRDRALFFHRPGRRQSAVRQGPDKLLVEWTPQGQIKQRQLFRVDPDPREVNDLAGKEPARAAALEKLLLTQLDAVNAEMPKPQQGGGKGKKKNATEE